MNERRKKEKGQVVFSLFHMVLLLSCYRGGKITFTADLHPTPSKSWNKGMNPAITPDLHEPRPGPSHLRDLPTRPITLRTKTEASSSVKLTEERKDASGDRRKTTNYLATISKEPLLFLCLFVLLFSSVYIYLLYYILSKLSLL
ncbi:hypothetical protein MHYP_G00023470 [Metynnis hypsauchen]